MMYRKNIKSPFSVDRFPFVQPSECLERGNLAGGRGNAASSALSHQSVYIGHINLAKSFNGAGEHFVGLIEALQRPGIQQYMLVRNVELAKRLDLVDGVTVGPVVRSALSAYCLMPTVDIVHIHGPSDGQAGLLLTLTRSIPYILTRPEKTPGNGPLGRAVYRRAAGMVYSADADATKHLRIYRHAVNTWHATAASS